MCYTDQAAALAIVKQRACISEDGQDDYLNDLLTASAGQGTGGLNYRPFFVAARYLDAATDETRITQADGVAMRNLDKTIEALLALQRGFDNKCEIAVPEGFEAVKVDCLDCNAPSEGTVATKPRPRTLRVTSCY